MAPRLHWLWVQPNIEMSFFFFAFSFFGADLLNASEYKRRQVDGNNDGKDLRYASAIISCPPGKQLWTQLSLEIKLSSSSLLLLLLLRAFGGDLDSVLSFAWWPIVCLGYDPQFGPSCSKRIRRACKVTANQTTIATICHFELHLQLMLIIINKKSQHHHHVSSTHQRL